ncbi:MAG: hypothetical protein ACPHID_03915 [Thermoplasmatota archaeon]
MDNWQWSLLANAVLFVGYAWLATDIGLGLQKGRQWRSNPMGVATFAIFSSCAIGHGIHAEHLAFALGPEADSGRIAHALPVVWLWHGATAIIVVWYLLQRKRLRLLHSGKELTADLDREREEARNIQATLSTSLKEAQHALNSGRPQEANRILASAIEEAGGVAASWADQGRVRPGAYRRRS